MSGGFIRMKSKYKFYAVKHGRKKGIYNTWENCQIQIEGFSNSQYRGFNTMGEAQQYMDSNNQNETQFTNNIAIAYVDGSYHKNTNEFSYGVVIFYKNKQIQFSQRLNDLKLAAMNNVAGEIIGAQNAMRFCLDNNIKNLELYYDYEGIEKWITGEWNTNKEGTKAYKKFYEDNIFNKLQIKFIKVKAHSGNKFNDLADSLAKNATKTFYKNIIEDSSKSQ